VIILREHALVAAGLPPDLVLSLPVPPSANALWSHPGGGKARVRSDAYRLWLHNAGWSVRMQARGFTTLAGTFDALLLVPEKSKRDRDNWSKPIFDLLQAVGIVRNDSGLRNYSVRGEDRDDCIVALWDRGGPEQRVSKPLRITKPKRRPSQADIRRGGMTVRHLP
jgi:Holliday junction resolvase RusA-like endonuclease